MGKHNKNIDYSSKLIDIAKIMKLKDEAIVKCEQIQKILLEAKKPDLTFNPSEFGGLIKVSKENMQKIIKLNEELTAENARLLTELEVANDRVSHFKHWNDGYKKQIKEGVESWAKEVDAKTDLQIELQSIKSKWWYKLMTWGWN